MARLNGKVAAITGGNSGIGRATAQRFASEGAKVYVFDKFTDSGVDGVTTIGGDVTARRDLDRFFKIVGAENGHLDVLFANAGVGNMAPLGSISDSDFDFVFGVNVKGVLFTVQAGLPLMKAGGSIILTSSTTGVMGTPAFSVYSASKAAVRNFARTWALDLKGTGIRVNVISPGATSTPGLHEGLAATGQEKEFLAGMAEAAPLGRIAQPEEIAAAVLFLASDDSSFMTGSEVFADGGLAQV